MTSFAAPRFTKRPFRSRAAVRSVDSLVCLRRSKNWTRLDFPDEFVPNSPVIWPKSICASRQILKFLSSRRFNMMVATSCRRNVMPQQGNASGIAPVFRNPAQERPCSRAPLLKSAPAASAMLTRVKRQVKDPRRQKSAARPNAPPRRISRTAARAESGRQGASGNAPFCRRRAVSAIAFGAALFGEPPASPAEGGRRETVRSRCAAVPQRHGPAHRPPPSPPRSRRPASRFRPWRTPTK